MLPYYFLVSVFMTFQKGRRRKSTRFGIWSTWLMFGDLLQKNESENSKLCCGISAGECFLWDLDDPICWTWMLYARRAVFWAFRWQFGFLGLGPSWGWAVIWWGCSPYPAHLHPVIRIFGAKTVPAARAYSQSLIMHKKIFETEIFKKRTNRNSHHPPRCVMLWPFFPPPK